VRDPSFYVSGLLELHKLPSAGEQRATWRQSMAALAAAIADDGPGPLDALHPEALVLGVRVALQAGLVDDLDWLDASAAGAALYELASALPIGAEQREIGRRVMSRMLAGDATVFAAIATRMALGAAKGLGSAAVRARIALLTELPLGLAVADGPLALALCSRRDLAREWIAQPSMGSLPARRLAARLIERAAREAARRAAQGDDHALRVFLGDTVRPAWERLLADRESLVWRHVAVARGLLAPWVPAYEKAIGDVLSKMVTPTEWRRAAASLAAEVAVKPEEAMQLASMALAGGLFERDPGCAVAFAWGAPRAAEAEPEAAGELLDWMMDRAPAAGAEAIVELRMELGASSFVDRAAARALHQLGPTKRDGSRDDGADALALEIARDLERTPRDDEPLREQLGRALLKFGQDGAREAYAAARELLSASTGAVDALHAVVPEDDAAEGRAGSMARRTSLVVLRDLDVSLLERDVLASLLRLGPSEAVRADDDALDTLRERLTSWILARESKPLASAEPAHPTLGLRRLRALLHLVDGDLGDASEDQARSAKLRRRWQVVASTLLQRFERDPPSVLRRTLSASLARALDALVRAGACDVSDVLLVVARIVEDAGEFRTLAEASMDPDLIHVLSRFATFAEVCTPPRLSVVKDADGSPASLGRPSALSMSPGAALEPLPDHVARLAAFDEMARELVPEGSGRSEALRTVLVRVYNALSLIVAARSLRGLCSIGGTEPEAVTQLESALVALAQLTSGARGRLDATRDQAMPLVTGSRPLTVAVSRVLSGAEPTLRDHVVAASLDELLAGVPRLVARLVAQIVWTLVELPVDRPSIESAPVKLAESLPAWIPARRTIGGFYVVRALSAGAVGSVFVVTRIEDRHDKDAERFALKVPEFSATAARSVSESEFLKMFRDEASALLTVPSHPNLARFVTFDAGARPKPILVMELVEGMTMDRFIESGAVDVKRAFAILDDILAGLEAMHGAGVGHLDLKPGNVVLRKQQQGVLVDFGLAGRHIRPGCATGPYGAPEVWGAAPEGAVLTPMAADIYAFGCVAFEALTGRTLFNGDNEMAQIAQHVAHDGFPPPLRDRASKPGFAAVAELLFSTLRRDPRARPSATALRAELGRVAKQVGNAKWPLA
jgi:hypothetical protein